MPHIVPFSEKRELCRLPIYQRPPRVMRVPDKFLDRAMALSDIAWSTATNEDQLTIFKLIEDIVTETLPSQINDEYFDKFVEIKEVPHGGYNSNTNN